MLQVTLLSVALVQLWLPRFVDFVHGNGVEMGAGNV